MMRSSFVYGTRALAANMGAGLMLLMLPALGQSPKVGDSSEARNMRLVGYNDLQARSAYQPTIHHQGDRYIAYVGHHGPEYSGTSIVDVSDPAQPRYLAHIPGLPGDYEEGGAQLLR